MSKLPKHIQAVDDVLKAYGHGVAPPITAPMDRQLDFLRITCSWLADEIEKKSDEHRHLQEQIAYIQIEGGMDLAELKRDRESFRRTLLDMQQMALLIWHRVKVFAPDIADGCTTMGMMNIATGWTPDTIAGGVADLRHIHKQAEVMAHNPARFEAARRAAGVTDPADTAEGDASKAEREAVAAEQQAREELSERGHAHPTVRDVFNYLRAEGVTIEGEPYAAPKKYETWNQRRKRGLRKLDRDIRDIRDT